MSDLTDALRANMWQAEAERKDEELRAVSERCVAAEAQVAELREASKHQFYALEELLSVAERMRGGDPEEWYSARDFARIQIENYRALASSTGEER